MKPNIIFLSFALHLSSHFRLFQAQKLKKSGQHCETADYGLIYNFIIECCEYFFSILEDRAKLQEENELNESKGSIEDMDGSNLKVYFQVEIKKEEIF